ncbi:MULTISPECIES: twin-arginine translocation signal domain-containing protein [Haloferacaceae]|uniref:Twin-arginine translocation signal domain-containing protein n=1 Tax=Halorubrum glutamatedens TaxID=2707018 RepID=A0ABD5QNA6_9EURY|nr:twin-arginine translocation signal domain-containing protein [Halobellus captivus]
MSRRKFMKAIAGGGAALGAAAMMPSAAALDIESNNPLSYNDNFSVGTQGELDLQGNNISDVGSINTSSVTAENLNNDRIHDTSGRYLGTLSGENDAQVLIDALTDRVSGAGIILPDPGFALDWEQQVDLPTESDFVLQTEGRPTLVPSSDFSDTAAIHLPEGGAERMYLDNLYVKDEHGVLTWGLYFNDLRNSTVYRPHIFNSPGIRMEAENNWSNTNMFFSPAVIIGAEWQVENRNGGTGYLLGDSKTNTVDQNFFLCPYYSATADFTEDDLGWDIRGKHNNIIRSRMEFAGTAVEVSGKNYHIEANNWDRVHMMENCIIEKEDAYGRAIIQGSGALAKSRITSPITEFEVVGDHKGSGSPRAGLGNLFDALDNLTTAHTLSALGLRDNSTNGSISINPTFFQHPFLRFNTGASAGNTAVLDTGSQSMKTQSWPAAVMQFEPGGAAAKSNVVVRYGYFSDAGNRAELVYDPGNTLGDHTSDNWYFEVETSGTLRDRLDLGVAPAEKNMLALNRVDSENGNPYWEAAIDGANIERIREGDATASSGRFRWYVETMEAANKDWQLATQYGGNLYRL